jgi:hypothetical protein
MPIDDIEPESPTHVSRRTLMKTAVGAGVAVAVTGTIGIAHADTGTRWQPAAGAPLSVGGRAAAAPVSMQAHGAVVAHVANAKAGAVELFTDGACTQLHDTDLAGRIATVGSGSPVVVHVLDASAGTLEVFSDGSRVQIRNADLAHRIVTAA